MTRSSAVKPRRGMRAHNFALYGYRDLQKRPLAQWFPAFADKDEILGSSPGGPTKMASDQ